jgi:hypothetical protein
VARVCRGQPDAPEFQILITGGLCRRSRREGLIFVKKGGKTVNVFSIESYVEYQAAERRLKAVELLVPAVKQMLYIGVRPAEVVEVLRQAANNLEDGG